MLAIEVRELSKRYGEVRAVNGVSFTVEAGQIYGYLGRNGSGKTTTVRMLTTLTRPTGGSASVAGYDVAGDPMGVKARIGVTMQDAALDPQMTGMEHLRFVAGILGFDNASARRRCDEMLAVFGLTDAADRACGNYSGGMKRRLDIATALLGDPQVLFLDEPTTGLDPQSRRALWDEIRRLKDRGVTVFLTTQYLEEAEVLTDHLAILDGGKVIAEGTSSGLKRTHGRKRIRFASDAPAESAAVLGTRPELSVSSAGPWIEMEAPAGISHAELLAILDKAGADAEPRELEIRDTSLEDVFLRLTGSDINQSQGLVAS